MKLWNTTDTDWDAQVGTLDVALLAGATFTGDVLVPDDAYDATAWNASLEVPTKNALRDKIETFSDVYAPLVSAGSLIGLTSYNPDSLVSYTSTTTLADIDATNLAVTFTAPPSGKVLVRLTAMAYPSTTSGTLLWGLREGTTTIIEAKIAADENTNTFQVFSKAFPVTGLTAGNSYTYKFAARHITNSWVTRYGGATSGDLAGPAVIEVVAAPF